MSEFTFRMGADGRRIKEEPVEEDMMDYEPEHTTHNARDTAEDEDGDLTMSDGENEAASSPEPSAPPKRSDLPRARRPDGLPFPSVCSEGEHRFHPHHHRLNCGHDIVTDQIEPCGKNCRLATYATEKIHNLPFECQHPTCKVSQNDVFVAKKGKGGRPIKDKFRPAILSHVYGVDAKADQQRREEKREKRLRDFSQADIGRSERIFYNKMAEGFERKRSASPEPGRPREPSPRKKKAQQSRREPAQEIVQRGKKISFQEYIDQARREKKEADQAKMDDAIAAQTKANSQQKAGKKASKWRYDFQCDVCMKYRLGSGFKCFACDDQEHDFDICLGCYEGHTHNQSHPMRLISRDDSQDLPSIAAHKAVEAVCECNKSTRYMVICDHCDKVAFHPGCCGTGKFFPEAYCQKNEESNIKNLKGDWRRWRKEGKRFLCKKCTQTKADVDDLTSVGFDEKVVDPDKAAKIHKSASLSKGIAKLSPYWLGTEKKTYHAEIRKAADIDEEIEVKEKWFAVLQVREDDEDIYYKEDPIESKESDTPEWKQGKKRAHEEVDSDDDDEFQEIDPDDFYNTAKRPRKFAVPRGMRDNVQEEAKKDAQQESSKSAAEQTVPAAHQPKVEDAEDDDEEYEPPETMAAEQSVPVDPEPAEEEDDDEYDPMDGFNDEIQQMVADQATNLAQARANPTIPGLFTVPLRPATDNKRW